MVTDERPEDARVWLRRQNDGETEPWSELEVTFLEPGATPDLLDTSYLSDVDRANPQIMANVAAIEDTAALITWVTSEPQRALGYWRGPSSLPLAEAPVVRFDDEGQFYLVGARSITEFYAFELEEFLAYEDDFLEENGLVDEDGDLDEDALRASITASIHAAGVNGEFRPIGDWEHPAVEVGPEGFHAERYQAHLGA